MSETHYDLIVIGSGSGLNVASAAVNQLGWRVAIIEKEPVGGTCLNRGCIPSKMVIHAADVAQKMIYIKVRMPYPLKKRLSLMTRKFLVIVFLSLLGLDHSYHQ